MQERASLELNPDAPDYTVRRMTHAPDVAPAWNFPYREWLVGATVAGMAIGLGGDSTPQSNNLAVRQEATAGQDFLLPSIPSASAKITIPSGSMQPTSANTFELPASNSAVVQTSEQTVPVEAPLQFVELAPSPPTYMWFYKRTESGLLDPVPYLDTPITQNQNATIIKGYDDTGRPIVDFVPGCLRVAEGVCAEEDYDGVNNMTLYGDPTSEPNPIELRNKSGVRIGLHTSNDPNKYRKGSDLHKAVAGDVQIVRTANGYFVYDLVEVNKVLKDAVISDPRFNGLENVTPSRVITFTCVSSDGDRIAPEDQENYFTVGNMRGGVTAFPDLSKL